LLRDGIARELTSISCNKGSILEFIWASAEKAMTIHVSGEDHTFWLTATRYENAAVALH
jgi:hypothetical protein